MKESPKVRTYPSGDPAPSLFDPPPQVEAVRRIPLRGEKGAGLYALIDEADYALVSGYKLYAIEARHGHIYAGASKGGKITLLHRLIMDAPKGVQVDHIREDRPDCRRSNLRLATQAQNQANGPSCRGSSSRYKGVYVSRGRVRARIGVNGRTVHLGCFPTEEDAARAYDAAARKHYGAFGRYNFPCEGERSALRTEATAGGRGC